jgi:hypothetical protein
VIDCAADLASIHAAEDAPELAGTWAAGSNTKSVTLYARHGHVNGGTEGLDLDRFRANVPATAFASGFSGANPVKPCAGQTFTVAGEGAWTVEDVETIGLGAGYLVTFSRRVQKGQA